MVPIDDDCFEQVTLLDGAVVSLRRLDKFDADAVKALHTHLSDREQYLRFFIVHPGFLDKFVDKVVEQSDTQWAIGAFEGEQLIGVANYVQAADPVIAEVAVAVAHGDYLRGVATALLRRLAEVARGNGVRYSTPTSWR
ncbi:MAG: GNAT family N-acetyltransferase [Mycolicibacterium sp.]|nr:GNAT family N-acetyltransferase [Mycolicibacterium sp.]